MQKNLFLSNAHTSIVQDGRKYTKHCLFKSIYKCNIHVSRLEVFGSLPLYIEIQKLYKGPFCVYVCVRVCVCQSRIFRNDMIFFTIHRKIASLWKCGMWKRFAFWRLWPNNEKKKKKEEKRICTFFQLVWRMTLLDVDNRLESGFSLYSVYASIKMKRRETKKLFRLLCVAVYNRM